MAAQRACASRRSARLALATACEAGVGRLGAAGVRVGDHLVRVLAGLVGLPIELEQRAHQHLLVMWDLPMGLGLRLVDVALGLLPGTLQILLGGDVPDGAVVSLFALDDQGPVVGGALLDLGRAQIGFIALDRRGIEGLVEKCLPEQDPARVEQPVQLPHALERVTWPAVTWVVGDALGRRRERRGEQDGDSRQEDGK